MSSNNFVKAKSNWVNGVKYKPPTVDKRGGKSVKIVSGGQWTTLQIPLMFTWGVNEFIDENTGVPKYSIALQFNPEKSDAEFKFLNQIKALQEKIYDDAVTNSKEWFGKSKMNRQVVEALCHPILKYPKKKDDSGEADFDRNPTLNVKLPYWNDKFNCELFDMSGKLLFGPNRDDNQGTPMTIVPKGTYVKGLIQCGGLWFVGGKFGLTWRLQQACVRPPQHLVGQGKCMLMDDSDDDAAEEHIKKEEIKEEEEEEVEAEAEVDVLPSFNVASSNEDEGQDEDEIEEEDEEDEDEEVVVIPVPAPKKKKKVVRKKKKNED